MPIKKSRLLPHEFKLPEGWETSHYALEDELKRELNFNFFHPLRWLNFSNIAKCQGSDDCLFLLHNHSYELAEVHLTWNREWLPKWPNFVLYKTWKEWIEAKTVS